MVYKEKRLNILDTPHKIVNINYIGRCYKLNMDELISRLAIAHKPIDNLLNVEDELVEKEVRLLVKFVEKIYPFATKKMIHGSECVLIYIFKGSINDTISNEVYLSRKGYIAYQVFDESMYRGYAPEAEVVDGYSKVRVDYFLKTKPLSEIIAFFDERPAKLKEQEYNLSETNAKRKKFIESFSDLLNE